MRLSGNVMNALNWLVWCREIVIKFALIDVIVCNKFKCIAPGQWSPFSSIPVFPSCQYVACQQVQPSAKYKPSRLNASRICLYWMYLICRLNHVSENETKLANEMNCKKIAASQLQNNFVASACAVCSHFASNIWRSTCFLITNSIYKF